MTTDTRKMTTTEVETLALALIATAPHPSSGIDLDEVAPKVLYVSAKTDRLPPTPERLVLALNRLHARGLADRATGPYEEGGEPHTRWRITVQGLLYTLVGVGVAVVEVYEPEPEPDPLADLLRGGPWDDAPIN